MSQPDPSLEALLLHLKEHRGFDFTGYKRSSLTRRVSRRMATVKVDSYADYLDYLEVHPEEFTALFNTILINVTAFFRDREAWDYLAAEILPRLVSAKAATEPIRVWSAGCASGEEAYTLAILLAEHLGLDAFRERVKIYATDVDEEGLAQARQATYTEHRMQNVPAGIRDTYFEATNGDYTFRKDLRRSVIFGRNDLVQDAPISRIDLLVCRNTLMYFTAETQARILSRFHFALADSGVLFLGKAEMLLSHSVLFTPIDIKRRVFQKYPRSDPAQATVFPQAPAIPARHRLGGLDALRDETLLASPLAQIVLTADGLVATASRQAEARFGVSARDIGRPFRDLELSYRPIELRAYIEQAQVERRTLRVPEVQHQANGELQHLEAQIIPLVDSSARLLGVSVAFHDVTETYRLREELEHTNRQLATAYEELQSTNEELETTNEELQSTVEELETTNEELQSTNEELETMNEELQSTNDELQSINEELHNRTGELDTANDFLEAILGSLRIGVTVLAPDLQVQVWNRTAEDLWGVRREEAVGQHFLNLDIGLPTEQLRPLIRGALAGDSEVREAALAAVNRRGRAIDVRVLASPLRDGNNATLGVILLMEQEETGPDGASG